MGKEVISKVPGVGEGAFNCPHCGAYAFQRWFNTAVTDTAAGQGKPAFVVTKAFSDWSKIDEKERKALTKLAQGYPFLGNMTAPAQGKLENVFASSCYHCQSFAVWVHEQLLWPVRGEAPPPNEDLPEDVRNDYLEAGTIVDLSPRGAAALLRLAIQKLCVHLGGRGENINDDIAALVKKGLDELIQQALDAVRVIGNNAVHPGKIDFNDNREMATSLFGLVNLITEVMISRPKHVKAMYNALPAGALAAIQKRDGKKA